MEKITIITPHASADFIIPEGKVAYIDLQLDGGEVKKFVIGEGYNNLVQEVKE